MRDVVLDANVLVGLLDPNDTLHERAVRLRGELEAAGDSPIIIDFLLEEAVSVLCRRAAQRRTNPPALARVHESVADWISSGLIETNPTGAVSLSNVLDITFASQGRLNCNDAKLVLLQRQGLIDLVATFDVELKAVEGFESVG